jgi:uncharacterized protein (TIGR03083 family)
VTAVDHRRLHDDEDADLRAYLHTLTDDEWDRPSLCDGWRVRDVVGHLLDGNELKLRTLPLRLARHGFSSDRSGRAYSIARASARPPAQLLAEFEARDPWAGTCRVFPPRLVLLDRLVHHQDIRRALGHRRVVPVDRLVACLDVTPRLGSVFGARRRTPGLRFEATDVTWSWGDPSAPLVRGPGEALLMAMLGRGDALADLDGPGVATLRTRVRPPVSPGR